MNNDQDMMKLILPSLNEKEEAKDGRPQTI